MAQGPGVLKQGKERHISHRRSHSAGGRPHLSSKQGRPYQQTTLRSDERLSRHTGNGKALTRNNGAKSRRSNGDGAPDMGIKNIVMDNSDMVQTVEIFKQPGQTLGFYIREGNGFDRTDGVFISRIQIGTVAETNGLLHIGDEILTVNNVEVGKMSLDDVVILMSIPRKLILKIRTKKNCNKKNASCPSLAVTEKEETPVVVLKKGRASSTTQLERTETSPDIFEQTYSSSAPQTDTDYFTKRFQRAERPPTYASIYITPQKAEAKLITSDDVNDSENSSEGSLPMSIDSGRDHYVGHRGYSAPMGLTEDPSGYLVPSSLTSYPHSQSELLESGYSRIVHPPERKLTHQRSPSKSSTMSQPGGFPPYQYSSFDSDRGAYSDPYQPLQEYHGYRGYSDGGKKLQGGFREMLHTKAKYGKMPRPRSPECYNSDSEVVYTHPRGQVAADSRGFASDYETYAGAMSDDDPVYAVPQLPTSGSSELQLLLRKFNTLSHELQQEQHKLQRQLTTAREQTGKNWIVYHVQNQKWGQGIRTPLSLKNHKNIGFHSNSGPDHPEKLQLCQASIS